jgi:hypothetical protein
MNSNTGYDPLRGAVVREAAAICNQCPWRVDLQEDPPEGVPAWVYEPPTRRALFHGSVGVMDGRRGIRDGGAVVCHPTDPINGGSKPMLCAASLALRQRCVLRWCSGGSREPLSGFGARLTIAEMVGVDPAEIGEGWVVDGVKITQSRLVQLAHPAVFDPNIATEGIPPATEEELRHWGVLRETLAA